jgi:RimJ/RimL family protein N-acetyltransferase
MLHELEHDQFATVRDLFRPLDFQPFCMAVLAGIYPGRVFVNDMTQPETGCVATRGNWVFLAGKTDNVAFNDALKQALWKREIASEKTGAVLFTFTPAAWLVALEAICQPRPVISVTRRHYVCRSLSYDWRAALPADASLLPLTPALLGNPDLTLPEDLRGTLEQWAAINQPDFADFGFLLMLGDQPAAWATIDGIVAGAGDLGFYTAERFRRRGLGTLVAAAAIDTGLAHGLSRIVWTCNANNPGSVATARKLGLERQPDYTLAVLIFDEAGSWVQLAYNDLTAGHYEAALAGYEKGLALLDEPPSWVLHDLARTLAGLGRATDALSRLAAAIAAGWKDEAETRGCPEFASVAGTPEWQALLDLMSDRRSPDAS